MRLLIIAPDGSKSERTLAGLSIRFGREPSCEVSFAPDLYPMVSGRHARIERTKDACLLTPLSQTNRTLLNDQEIDGAVKVRQGDRIRLGVTGPTIEILAIPPFAETPRPNARPANNVDGTVMAGSQELADLPPSAQVQRLPISKGGVVGRKEGHVEFVLDHALVSRRHARVSVEGKRVLLHDLGSANGTFVNGERLGRQVELKIGDRIDIGPFALEFNGDALVSQSRSNNIELAARSVRRVVKNRTTGQPLTLLDGIDLVIRPHEFVCLLGPSGSGKTTLLSALSGRLNPNEGRVLVNGTGLHANFEALKQDIAVVPQKDALHDSLAVEQALWYTAKLRLPPDTSRTEINSAISEMLQTVGLTERRATAIRHLSGGQIKRASLANEILCKPSLLFLDEVTSGLDEQTDREVMRLFRSLADAGKTVVCITHSLANVERNCHLVVILTVGGKLAFIGKPAEALSHFGIDRLGDVYDRLAEQPAEHWQKAFRKSPHWQSYVADRLPPETAASARPDGQKNHFHHRLRMFLRQTILLTSRYAAIWRGDYWSFVAMAGQSLVVAVLMGLLFGNLEEMQKGEEHARRVVSLMFLLAVSSFWFGCNNAAKEIVKERVIYTRERNFNLLFTSYYASKFLLLSLYSCLQTVLMYVVVRIACHPPGPFSSELTVLGALALAGVSTGLAISAFAATEEIAITIVPMAIIPQIILSGVIAPLANLSEWVAIACISTYWGKRGLEAALPTEVANAIHLERHSTSTAMLVLLLHTCGAIVVALAALWWQNRRRFLGAT